MRPLVLPETLNVRTGPELRAAIEAAAAIEGSTASEWVRRTLAAITAPAPDGALVSRQVAVSTEQLSETWPTVAPWLDAACSVPGSDHTAETLRGICERREGLLILIVGQDGKPIAAGVTQLRNYASGRRSLWILALGGSAAGPWRDVIAEIEAGAARHGATMVEFVGRAAWKRILPDYVAIRDRLNTYFSKTLER